MIFSMAGEIPAIEFYLWAGRVPVYCRSTAGFYGYNAE